MTGTAHSDAATVIEATRRWLEQAVIGLNLCPFAKSVRVKGQIHYVVSQVTGTAALRQELLRELKALHEADPEVRDTTLLIVTGCLQDFLAFNDFLDEADAVLDELGLQGVLQIASFHPQFQFAGTEPDDITNYTNRAPYPILHLLREASIDRAVEAFPEAETIYEKNMQTLERLGHAGWAALNAGPAEPPANAATGPDAGKKRDTRS